MMHLRVFTCIYVHLRVLLIYSYLYSHLCIIVNCISAEVHVTCSCLYAFHSIINSNATPRVVPLHTLTYIHELRNQNATSISRLVFICIYIYISSSKPNVKHYNIWNHEAHLHNVTNWCIWLGLLRFANDPLHHPVTVPNHELAIYALDCSIDNLISLGALLCLD